MTLPESPFTEILDALWRKVDDDAAGAELLHLWAYDSNPNVGLTRFRVDDSEFGGFPRSFNSSESPALHIGNASSDEHGWAVSRTIELTERFKITGALASRNSRDVEQFLWLVYRAFLTDYPRLLDSNGSPLSFIKRWQIVNTVRTVNAETNRLPFWKFELDVVVVICFNLSEFT